MAVYFTLLKPGDTVLGMNLAHGGHLTHGHPLNFSGKLYKIVPYGVRKDDERIDYDELERLAHEHKPKMIMVGASAYPRVIDFERIGAVGATIGAPVVTDMAHIAGLVAAKIHPSPVPHSDFVTTTTHKTLRGPRGGLVLCRDAVREGPRPHRVPGHPGRAADARHRGQGGLPQGSARSRTSSSTRSRSSRTRSGSPRTSSTAGFRLVSGGTDNHLMLVDVFSKGLTGKVAEAALGKAGITVNKNAIPFDQNPPMVASGIRIGTPAVTTRGMREAGDGHRSPSSSRARSRRPTTSARWATVKGEVEALCRKFPLYPGTVGLDAGRRAAGSARRRGRRLRAGWRRSRERSPASSRAQGQLRDGGRGRGGLRRRRRAARRSGHRHRQDARLPRPGHPQPASACSSRPAPRTCRNRSSSRTFRCSRESLGVKFTATYMKGRGNYLCLHRFEESSRQRRRSARRDDDALHPTDRRMARGHRRPAIAPRSRTCRRICRSGTTSRRAPRTASAPTARTTTTASSRGCASAPPNPTS